MPAKLIFIYNADSGKLNALGHSLHKLISPSTYSCSLCSLTHGFFKEKEIWSAYLNDLDLETEFCHKDENSLSSEYELPVVLKEANTKIEELISASELSKLSKLEDLIDLLRHRLKA